MNGYGFKGPTKFRIRVFADCIVLIFKGHIPLGFPDWKIDFRCRPIFHSRWFLLVSLSLDSIQHGLASSVTILIHLDR
jgi:hypothetical protein